MAHNFKTVKIANGYRGYEVRQDNGSGALGVEKIAPRAKLEPA
jgi:hypothetical protein